MCVCVCVCVCVVCACACACACMCVCVCVAVFGYTSIVLCHLKIQLDCQLSFNVNLQCIYNIVIEDHKTLSADAVLRYEIK